MGTGAMSNSCNALLNSPALSDTTDLIDLIGPNNPVDDVAHAAGTIGYEILTSLGPRYHRVYTQIS